jgi:hypothetical protein
MPKTKRKNDKKTTAISKIARTTVGLVVRVGDAVEAIAVAATTNPVPVTPRSKPPTAPDPPTSPVAQSEEARALDAKPTAPALEAPPTPVPPAPTAPSPATPVVAVNQEILDQERAAAAVETYATLHNLRTELMPSRATLVAALRRGMAEHGPAFCEAHVQVLLDAEMRSYFRSLGSRTGSP